jgi:hypothetical protein
MGLENGTCGMWVCIFSTKKSIQLGQAHFKGNDSKELGSREYRSSKKILNRVIWYSTRLHFWAIVYN